MIELSGLRRYNTPNNRTRLEADIKFFGHGLALSAQNNLL